MTTVCTLSTVQGICGVSAHDRNLAPMENARRLWEPALSLVLEDVKGYDKTASSLDGNGWRLITTQEDKCTEK